MPLLVTPQIGRRRFLIGGAAAAGSLLAPSLLLAQQGRLAPTPAQTPGPFYPTAFPPDVDNDLVVLRGSEGRAEGVVTHITGRVLNADGKPIPNAEIEIWQCDAHGNYLHPASRGARPRDKAFQGFGRTVAAADGTYSFRTIRPVPYSGRTPHIHFGVAAPQRKELVTQMYVAGEPDNERDGLYRSLGRQRDAVTVKLEAANGIEAGALAGEFNIVLA
jgi:protocatechuate 3,4-dioxygenase beta subunit